MRCKVATLLYMENSDRWAREEAGGRKNYYKIAINHWLMEVSFRHLKKKYKSIHNLKF